MILTASQTSTLLHALRVAEQTYREDAAAMHAGGQERIAKQFDQQIADASALHDLIEEASHVALGGL